MASDWLNAFEIEYCASAAHNPTIITAHQSSGFGIVHSVSATTNEMGKVNNKEYFFLIEILYILEKKGYKIFDIPINLKYRVKGVSKMRLSHIFNSLIYLILLSFKKKF